jgi:hypothetical protein
MIGRAARAALQRTLPHVDARAVWAEARHRHRDVTRDRPAALGVLGQLLEWDLALHDALRQAGVGPDDIGRAVTDLNWAISRPGIVGGFAASRLLGGARLTHVRRVIDALFATLFVRPFARTTLPSIDTVAFDVTRCPIAEYFAAHGVPELTPHAGCTLDYRMAEAWSVTLERTRTIAAGDALCDFRFVPLSRGLSRGQSP